MPSVESLLQMKKSPRELLIDRFGKEHVAKRAEELETLRVLTYELGELVHDLTYARWTPDCADAYRAAAKAGMMDLLTQAWLVCEEQGWDFNECRITGRLRMEEKLQGL